MSEFVDWNVDGSVKDKEKSVRRLQTFISIFLALGGLFIVLSQLVPLASSYFQGLYLQTREKTLAAPVPNSYKEFIEGEFAYYDPGKSYFENLSKSFNKMAQDQNMTYDPETKAMRQAVINTSYTRKMRLSISSIGINNVSVTTNVESYEEKVYNKFLKEGLAHFKGTPLPGDGGNSFIYGHSAVQNFFNSHQDLAQTIFSKLEKVDIGNEVRVEKDGVVYTYVVRKKKIVEPEDFSILSANGDKETLTLMTCWPNGIGTKRLIVIAERNG